MPFTTQELQAGFLIGDCRIEPRENRIVRGDTESRLEPRVMDVLVCLAAHAGEVVSRDTLNQQVWTHLVVTDQAVTNCISELRQHLGDDRTTHRVIETIPKRGYRLMAPVTLAPQPAVPPAPARRPVLFGVGVLLLGAVLTIAWWRSQASSPALTSVVVLRFENAAGDQTLDYMALALPDEIATLLTHSHGLAVRPIGYVDGDDPLARARARHVDHIVSGRYYLEDDGQLSLAIEAQNVLEERVVWRTRISVPNGDLLAMRGRLAEGVRGGLLPALGARAATATISPPTDGEAYQLYLRTLAMPHQPTHSERAIEMLERAVTLEPKFAQAWNALGLRYYDYYNWWGGAGMARQKSLAAHRRALELDPEFITAARSIVSLHTEGGDLEGAYRESRRLLDHFGAGPETHFSLAYVYRYGGMLDDAQRQCELAREFDPQNARLRSCAYAYLYAGKLEPVMGYLELDEGSYFVNWGKVLYYLRTDSREATLYAARQAAAEPSRALIEPCLEGARGAAIDGAVADFVAHWQKSLDPETAYGLSPILVYCGRGKEALQMVERAVDGSFCSFPALDLDPIWAPLRSDSEFQRIRIKAMACHERFRQAVESYDADPNH